MEITKRSFEVETTGRFEIENVTGDVESAIEDAGITDGLVHVYSSHTTAVVSTNEFEERLLDDMIEKFHEFAPPEDGYTHDRHHYATDTQPNAHAHIICAMLKNTVLMPLIDGELDLGTWEEVMFFEVDGPNTRTINVAIYS